MQILDCRLDQTCGACPEQYDVYRGDRLIGYLRLRYGYFSARYPDSEGSIVYDCSPKGDGCFDSDEREYHLVLATKALIERDDMKADHASMIVQAIADYFDSTGMHMASSIVKGDEAYNLVKNIIEGITE